MFLYWAWNEIYWTDAWALVDYRNCCEAENEIFFKKSFANINLLSANPTKWSNTLSHSVGNLPTNCLSVFSHFVGLALTNVSFLYTLWRCFQSCFQRVQKVLNCCVNWPKMIYHNINCFCTVLSVPVILLAGSILNCFRSNFLFRGILTFIEKINRQLWLEIS